MVEKGKFYYETPCEHGYVNPHQYDKGSEWMTKRCPGGTRTEVTIDIEAAKAEGERQRTIPHVQWLDYCKIVDAALVEGGNP